LLGLASAALSAAMIAPPPAVADSDPAPAQGDLNGLALPDRPTGAVPHENAPPTHPLIARARAPASVSAWVTVRTGQSLWEISRGRLPADATPDQIAALTRSVYLRNGRTIGNDPDLIRPGEHLAIPQTPHETYSEDS
jgi:nucleoid-associated protein YgaU